jgi:hypothetical protein
MVMKQLFTPAELAYDLPRQREQHPIGEEWKGIQLKMHKVHQGQVLFYQGCHRVRRGKRGAFPDKANVGRCTYQATPRSPVLSHEEQADGLPRISLGRRELECCSTLDEPHYKGWGAA